MSKMDKKQRKAKKREEKVKKIKTKQVEDQSGQLTEEQKKSGTIQLYLFFAVAIAGALFIILNVK